MADRNDCYKYTSKMIEAPTRDESRIKQNQNSEDIEKLRIENAEQKKMILELRQSVNELAKDNSEAKTDPNAEEIEAMRIENAELKKMIQELGQTVNELVKSKSKSKTDKTVTAQQ